MKKSKIGLILLVMLLMTVIVTTVKPVSGEPSNNVRVWVTYRSGGKAFVMGALKRENAEFHYDFPQLNAYVVTLPEAALSGILRNPFIADVEADPVRYPIEPVKAEPQAEFANSTDENGQTIPWGIDVVQAREVWDPDFDGFIDNNATTGAGITVCVIDTGYYADHDDLKVEHSGYSQISGENWYEDGAGHGSHVAGTIGALNNGLGVVGVSPGEVDYHIVKIFNNDGVWASGSDLVDAIYNCRDNDADVISMSLGGTFKSRTEQKAFDALYANNNILHVAAAGNDGNTRLSYPASYSSVISVAAIDSNLVVADFSQQNSAVELAAPGVGVLSTVPFLDETKLTVNSTDYTAYRIEYSPINITATGVLVDGGLCDSTSDWSGDVVLCQRGEISFYDKVMNVQNSGGLAAVIYNNEPGDFLGTLGEGYSSTIPAASISQELGLSLVVNATGTLATVTNTYASPGSGYEAWNGTSMATPHVAGVAALIWSANSSWTNVQIRDAMNATAKDLGASGRDNAYGYGLVQAYDALQLLGGGGGTTDDPPSVSITNPEAGTTVSGTVIVTADASDDNGVSQVEFFVDGGSIGVDKDGSDGWSASWVTTTYSNGTHSVSATATDTVNQTATDSVSVTVDNSGGTTYPIDLSVYAYKVRGNLFADLTWVNATSTFIDVYRDGTNIATTENDSAYTDGPVGKGGGSATYQVCEADTTNCSNEVNVIW